MLIRGITLYLQWLEVENYHRSEALRRDIQSHQWQEEGLIDYIKEKG